jgi:hypothetical protein
MDSKKSKELTFKKNNLSINLLTKPVFNADSENEVYYSSANKIFCFDYSSNLVNEKFTILKSKKIIKFLKHETFFYILSSEGMLYEYDTQQKLITKTFINDDKVVNFCYSKFLNSLVLINIKNNLLILDRDTFTITKQKTVQAVSNDQAGQFTFMSLMDIDFEGKSLICNIKNRLIFINLLNLEIQTFDYVKAITCGVFLSDNSYVVGDISGKLHFVSMSEDKKVKIKLIF